MPMSSRNILLIDPLSLTGRELLRTAAATGADDLSFHFLHTADDDEHQIADIGGDPALVPPLEDPSQLEEMAVVVVGCEADSPRLEHLERFMDLNPTVPVIDLSRLQRLRPLTAPIARPSDLDPDRLHLRLARPGIVAAATVLQGLHHLDPEGGALLLAEPVSAHGKWAIEALARQATHRLQGETVRESIAGHTLAFNLVASVEDLTGELAAAIPGLPMSGSLTTGGWFHGDLAFLTLRFPRELDEAGIREALEDTPGLAAFDEDLTLDRVIDSDRIGHTLPVLSPDRRQLSLTLMVDGLRIGGALTAYQLVQAIASPSQIS